MDDRRWIERVGREEWDEMVAQWRDVIKNLISGFMSGDASVDPALYGSGRAACDYCDQMPLCRIFEGGPLGRDREGEDEG